jgi:diadenosine tetraphosphate (Ap4A) HIT family hydrolase
MSTSAAEKPCNQLYERIFSGEKPDQVTFRSLGHDIFTVLAYPQATAGHTLVVPNKCYPRVDQLPHPLAQKIDFVARATGIWLQTAFKPDYVAEMIAGKQVAHAHVHRVPCYEGQDWLKVMAHPADNLHPVMSLDQKEEIFNRATLPIEYGMAIELGLGNMDGTNTAKVPSVDTFWTMAHDLTSSIRYCIPR